MMQILKTMGGWIYFTSHECDRCDRYEEEIKNVDIIMTFE